MTTIVYEPCSICAGKGSVPFYPWSGLTVDTMNGNVSRPCETCGGTGKGSIKEIREP